MSGTAAFWSRRGAEAAAGIGGCLAGWWAARVWSPACSWLLVALDAGEPADGFRTAGIRLGEGAGWWSYALNEFGPLVLGVAACLMVLGISLRLRGVWSLAAACAGFLLAMPLLADLVSMVWRGRSTTTHIGQALGLPLESPLGRWLIAVLCALAVAALVRAGLRRSGAATWSGMAIPAVAMAWALGAPGFGERGLQGTPAAYLPVVLALTIAVSVRVSAATLMPIRSVHAMSLLAIGSALAAIPVSAPRGATRVDWVAAASPGWALSFEAGRFTPGQRAEWLKLADRRLAGLRDRLDLPNTGQPLRLRIAVSEGAMAMFGPGPLGSRSFALDAADRPAVVAADGLVPEDLRAEAVVVMRQAWGPPGSASMEMAVARYAVGAVGGERLIDAGSRIACEERQYSAEEVFAAGGDFLSPLVRDAVGGAWVENAVRRMGRGVLGRLQRESLRESLALCRECVPPCSGDAVVPLPPRGFPRYAKGISFSHEGRGGAGYGSEPARRQLERIREVGANAIALVPYAFTPAPERAEIRFRTLETDTRLLRSARVAERLGLAVVLKPHLWAGRQFHGDITFESEQRFDQWFDDYRRWMLHYARLAQVQGVELLCIGNELAGLTGRSAAWMSLIADVRSVYGGPLTYAAHWDSELESVEFWNALDYIGVNFYFPIAAAGDSPSAGSPEIADAARRIERVQARFGKPVLFTEVGFPALATAASRPWEENGSRLDPDLQSACYRIWMEAFAMRPRVLGMFWWKWPSDGSSSPFDGSHRPLGKPAMGVLSDWFARL